MKVTMRHPVEVKLFVTVVLATCLFVAAVNAQPRFRGKFTLPCEVHSGDVVLPAGEYFLSMDPFGAAAWFGQQAARQCTFQPPQQLTAARNVEPA